MSEKYLQDLRTKKHLSAQEAFDLLQDCKADHGEVWELLTEFWDLKGKVQDLYNKITGLRNYNQPYIEKRKDGTVKFIATTYEIEGKQIIFYDMGDL